VAVRTGGRERAVLLAVCTRAPAAEHRTSGGKRRPSRERPPWHLIQENRIVQFVGSARTVRTGNLSRSGCVAGSMHHVPPAAEGEPALVAVEATLRQLLGDPASLTPPPRPARGRPPILPAAALWAGLLVGLLRGLRQQLDIWRLLSVHGLWDLPRYEVTDMALYSRLEHTPPAVLQQFFAQITALLQQRFAAVSACSLAPFAREILALDHTVLDAVLRKRKLLRELPPGDACLLPGALGCLFDVRRQQFRQLAYTADPQQDLRKEAPPLVAGLRPGTLLLFDLGYFAFWWFDQLTEAGLFYVTRLRDKVTWEAQHVFYDGGNAAVRLWDGLVYLGRYRADRAGHPVRLLRITVRQGGREQDYTYLTNVLDPRQLPAWEVAELYRRRWDIEKAFDLVKSHLGLKLLWSSFPNVVLHQVFATFIITQIVLALRTEVAQQAGCDLREVSLPLLIRWLPQLARDGHDPLAEFAAKGRQAGYIRPFRGQQWVLPVIPPEEYRFPDRPIPSREPRYGSRDYCARTYEKQALKQVKRQRYWSTTQGDE
jgi:hypothetical protein